MKVSIRSVNDNGDHSEMIVRIHLNSSEAQELNMIRFLQDRVGNGYSAEFSLSELLESTQYDHS